MLKLAWLPSTLPHAPFATCRTSDRPALPIPLDMEALTK